MKKSKELKSKEMYIVIDSSGSCTDYMFKIAKDKKQAEEFISEMMANGVDKYEIEIIKGKDLVKVDFTLAIETTRIIKLDN